MQFWQPVNQHTFTYHNIPSNTKDITAKVQKHPTLLSVDPDQQSAGVCGVHQGP